MGPLTLGAIGVVFLFAMLGGKKKREAPPTTSPPLVPRRPVPGTTPAPDPGAPTQIGIDAIKGGIAGGADAFDVPPDSVGDAIRKGALGGVAGEEAPPGSIGDAIRKGARRGAADSGAGLGTDFIKGGLGGGAGGLED